MQNYVHSEAQTIQIIRGIRLNPLRPNVCNAPPPVPNPLKLCKGTTHLQHAEDHDEHGHHEQTARDGHHGDGGRRSTQQNLPERGQLAGPEIAGVGAGCCGGRCRFVPELEQLLFGANAALAGRRRVDAASWKGMNGREVSDIFYFLFYASKNLNFLNIF